MIALSKFQLYTREVSVTVIGQEREIKLHSLSHYCPFGKALIHIFFTRLWVKQQARLDPLVLKSSQKDYLEFKTVQQTTKNTSLMLPQIRGSSQIIRKKNSQGVMIVYALEGHDIKKKYCENIRGIVEKLSTRQRKYSFQNYYFESDFESYQKHFSRVKVKQVSPRQKEASWGSLCEINLYFRVTLFTNSHRPTV